MTRLWPWLLLIAACDAPSGAASGTASASATQSAVTTTQTASAAPAVEEKRPRYTSDEALGKLPEGIGIAVGDAAPDFGVRDHDGKEVALSALIAERDLLLFFHRGASDPYSHFQVRMLARNADAFKALGIRIAMISVDDVAGAAAMKKRHDVPFPLLSDPDKSVHRAYRVLDAEGAAAMPAVFLIMRDGKVRWAHADTDVATRPNIAKIEEALHRLL